MRRCLRGDWSASRYATKNDTSCKSEVWGKITRQNVITRRVKYALGNKKVAVKIQKLTPQTQCQIVEEYRVLRDLSGHPNLPDFYGIYRRRSARKSDHDEMWFVMEVSLDQSRLAKWKPERESSRGALKLSKAPSLSQIVHACFVFNVLLFSCLYPSEFHGYKM